MRHLGMAVLVVALAGCDFGVKTCSTDGECPAGSSCSSNGFCVLNADSGSGGGGGTTGGGGGGGTGGGQNDSGVDGGQDGGSVTCAPGLVCAGWQECVGTTDGGYCADSQYRLRILSPDAGIKTQNSFLGRIEVTKADGGVTRPAAIPVRNATDGLSGSLGPANAEFTGALDTFMPDGVKTFIVGWEDGGPFETLTLRRDTTGPSFSVSATSLPSYGPGDAGFLEMDPSESLAGLPLVKKDETIRFQVTTPDTDVVANSLAVTVRAGNQIWDAGQPLPCSGSGFCREFVLGLGLQPLNAFSEDVSVQVTALDDLQNQGGSIDAGIVRVTRWKWARQFVSGGANAVRSHPAINIDGVILVGVEGGGATSEGVHAVTPTGQSSRVSSAGPVAAGVAIGQYQTGETAVLFMTTNVGLQHLDGGQTCGAASTGNVGTLAILNDGAPTDAITNRLAGVSVVGSGTGRQLRALDPAVGCVGGSASASGALGMSYPGNTVTIDDFVYYPASDGTVARFNTSAALFSSATAVTGIGAGTIYGISLLRPPSGLQVAGGGGAGVGRLFVKRADNDGGVTGFNPSTHVSGVAIDSANNLFAVVEKNGNGSIRKFDSTGEIDGGALELRPGDFAFPLSSIPGATTPVLGQGGWVYATANNGTVVGAGQSTLDLRWSKLLPPAVTGEVIASPTLDCNRTKPGSNTGVYYFATTSGWLVGYITESAGLDVNAAWPKYQHDARNTGNFRVPISCQ